MKVSNKMKKNLFAFVLGLFAFVTVQIAQAANLIDAAGTTAITAGFTDLIDTVKGVLSVSWQYMLGGLALMAAPKIVARMFHIATGK